MVAYVRTVKTASGASAVQIVWSARRGSRQIEHLGSAHDDGEVEALKAAARQRLAEGQGALDLGLNTAGADGDPLEIVGSKSGHLWEALCRAYQLLGFDTATGGDGVLRDLVLARIIEPTSKADSLRVLAETGVVDYRSVTRPAPELMTHDAAASNQIGLLSATIEGKRARRRTSTRANRASPAMQSQRNQAAPQSSVFTRPTQPPSVMMARLLSAAPVTSAVTVRGVSGRTVSVSPGPAAAPSPRNALSATVTAFDSVT